MTTPTMFEPALADEPREMEVVQPSALEAMERASIDVQISTARRFPRQSITRIRQRMIDMATIDAETAATCFYSLKRSGKMIQGESVRLAEIAAACYGNLRVASRLVANDGKTVKAQGICHDLETNYAVSIEAERRITDKEGRTYSEDMQVTTGQAAISIALRNSIFRVIPKAVLKPVYERCMQVATGNAKTLEALRDECLMGLEKKFGVGLDRVLAHLELTDIEQIGMAECQHLIGVATAIRDKEATIEEQFPPVAKKPTPLKKILEQKAAEAQAPLLPKQEGGA